MWEVIKDWIFDVIAWFQSWCGDWGLAIILVTIVFRLLLTPLIHKQQKSSMGMQKIQPEVNRIKERFPDDKQRQNEEMQKLYAETKFNPLAGCVPMLIQIPICMALFQTLRYEMVERNLSNFCFYNLIDDLSLMPSDAFAIGIGTFVPYLILMIVFAFATFIPMLLTPTADPTQRKTTLLMTGIMSLMMLWFSWQTPAGVLLFWGTSSILAIIQMQVSKKIIQHDEVKEEEEILAKPIEVNVARKEKKKRQTKKH